jgi:diaminopimelate epimerase
MDAIRFTKMSGAGNDFIVIDNRDGKIPETGRRKLFAEWCHRRLGVGADGVLLVENPAGGVADFRMRYYNADGGEAESCGNGARCIARFANLIGAAPETMAFETEAGLYRAQMNGDEVILTMSDPHSLRRDISIEIEGFNGAKLDYVNTGVPHVVVFVKDIKSVDVQDVGSRIRYHEAFAPAGTNVNFAQQLSDGRIAVRTYERGVEGETLACGTGSVAVGLIAWLKGIASPPVSIQTTGGPILRIHFDEPEDREQPAFTGVRLEGEARIVFEGELAGSLSGSRA